MKIELSMTDVNNLAGVTALSIYKAFRPRGYDRLKLYAVPRGGVPAAFAIGHQLMELNMDVEYTPNINFADVIIDDLIDSGATAERIAQQTDAPLYVLIDKRTHFTRFNGNWIVFPWEGDSGSSIRDNLTRVVQYLNPSNYDIEGTVNNMMQNLEKKNVIMLNTTIRNEQYGKEASS